MTTNILGLKTKKALDNIGIIKAQSDASDARSKIAEEKSYEADERSAYQKQRLDMLVANGEKPSELVDIRLGVDGTEYATAGERVSAEHQKVTNQVEEISISTSQFPRLVVETNDYPRLQRAIDSLPDGKILNLTEDMKIKQTPLFSKKKDIRFRSNGRTITPTQRLLYMISISDCENVVIEENLFIDGLETAVRGIEVVRTPKVRIECTIQNFGNKEETEAVAGVVIKEGCDHFKISNANIKKIHGNAVAAGIWIESFTGLEYVSRHGKVLDCEIEDIYPREDADGIKILCGTYLGDVDLLVQNNTITNSRKRGIKFQARGCTSMNNIITFQETNSYAAIDFQRGHGLSLNDKMVIDIEGLVNETSDNLYYTGIHISGPNVEVDKHVQTILNGSEESYIVRGPLSRPIQVDSLEGQIVENITIHNCELIGHGVEFKTQVKNFKFKDNKFTVLRGDTVIQNDQTLINFVWDDNELVFLGETVNVLYVVIESGYIDVNLSDSVERYLPPLNRNKRTEYHVRMSDEDSPLNYHIVNDKCITKVSSYPQTANLSRYNALFKYAKVGDEAYKPNSTQGTDESGRSYYEDHWICIAAPSTSYPRGMWRTKQNFLT